MPPLKPLMVNEPTLSTVLYSAGQVAPPSSENSMLVRFGSSAKVKVIEPLLLSQFGSVLSTVTSGRSSTCRVTWSVASQPAQSVTVTV